MLLKKIHFDSSFLYLFIFTLCISCFTSCFNVSVISSSLCLTLEHLSFCFLTAEGWRRAVLPETTGGQQAVSDLLLCGFVLQAEPLVQFPLTNSLLGQPPEDQNTQWVQSVTALMWCVRSSVSLLHQVLVPGLAELDQVRFDAVHLLVDLSVVGRLLLQVDLQVPLAVHDLADPRLQLVVVLHDPETETRVRSSCSDCTWFLRFF